MTQLARYQGFAQDGAGNVLPNATVQVTREFVGGLEPLFADVDGATTKSNSFTADSDGYYFFHCRAGFFRIDVTKGGLTRTYRYVGIGTAQGTESQLIHLPEAVSIEDYGAVASDPSKYAENAQAFTDAFAASPQVYCPAGKTYHVSRVFVPSTAKGLNGNGATLIAAGSPANGLVIVISTTDFVLRDIAVEVDIDTYPTVAGVFSGDCTNLVIDHVKSSGQHGIVDFGSTNITIQNSVVSDYAFRGLYLLGSIGSRLINNDVDGTGGSASHGISMEAGTDCWIANNRVKATGQFGISVAGHQSTFDQFVKATVTCNKISGSALEAINIDNSSQFIIVANDTEFDGNSTDLGISVFGSPDTSPQGLVTDGAIVGNKVNGPNKAGIALICRTKRVTVAGNQISNANAGGGSNPAENAGVVIFGGGAEQNSVSSNTISDPDGNLAWLVHEFTDASGTPDYNMIGTNFGFSGTTPGGASGYTSIVGAHSTKEPTLSDVSSAVLTFLGAPSSANLAAAVTGETGTGPLVFGTSPSLTTPDLGTPSTLTLTNATGLPISTGVSGLGTGIATFLATPSSANLATAVTNETGSGALVFATDSQLGGHVGVGVAGFSNVALTVHGAGATSATSAIYAENSAGGALFNVKDDGNVAVASGGLSVGTGTVAAGDKLTVAGAISSTATIKTASYTVGTLPSASGAGAAARAYVTDSNATLAAGIGNTVAGGGANITPVYSDGTNWKIG